MSCAAALTPHVFAQDQVEAEAPDPARLEADTPPQEASSGDVYQDYADFKQRLEDEHGFIYGLNFDLTNRSALAGPESDINRSVARYDLLLRQKVGGTGLISMDVRGSWGSGLDNNLGLFANTDQYVDTEEMFILHLYYQQTFLDEQLTLRAGKFDIGDWLDTNEFGFYNFLGYTFAHTGTIGLTGNTLGAMATYDPNDADWYVGGGFSNSEQTPYDSGLNNIFDSDTTWLSIAEVGYTPTINGLEGNYRFIAWHDSQDYATVSGVDSEAVGVALSFDQKVTDRLGLFARYGVNDGDPLEPKQYYSAGFVVENPFAIDGRDDDSLGLGVVVNEFTDGRSTVVANATDTETYWELYYNYQLNPLVQLQPVFQVVQDPGGVDQDDAVILGLHVALRF